MQRSGHRQTHGEKWSHNAIGLLTDVNEYRQDVYEGRAVLVNVAGHLINANRHGENQHIVLAGGHIDSV